MGVDRKLFYVPTEEKFNSPTKFSNKKKQLINTPRS